MKFYELRRSFFRKRVQIRRYFATKCTIRGTRGAKLQVDATFSGRSMVEMLGVLAIIGVLSVGAIAGYSKAMMKYKLNKFSESYNILLNYALQYTPQLETNGAQTQYNEILYKLNLIPDGMTYVVSEQRIYDIFNNRIVVYRNVSESGIPYNILALYLDKSPLSKKICQTCINIAKENASQIYHIRMKDEGSENGASFSNGLYGTQSCNSTRKCLHNMTLTDTSDVCDFCDTAAGSCKISIVWNL